MPEKTRSSDPAKRSGLRVELCATAPALVKSCIFLIRPKARMERNPSGGTRPVHVPLGHIVANEKWRGSQLAQEMQGQSSFILLPSQYVKRGREMLDMVMFFCNPSTPETEAGESLSWRPAWAT